MQAQQSPENVPLSQFVDYPVTVRTNKGALFKGILAEVGNENGEIKLRNAHQVEPDDGTAKNPTDITFVMKEVAEIAVLGKDNVETLDNVYLTVGSDCGTSLKLRLTEEVLDYLASLSSGRTGGGRRRNTGGRSGALRNGLPARYDPTREQYESVHITLPKSEIACRGNPILVKGQVDKKAEGEKYYKKDEFFDHLSSSTLADSFPLATGSGLGSTLQTLVGIYLRDQGRNQSNSLTFGQHVPEYVRLMGRGGGWGNGGTGGLGRNGGRWGRDGGRGAGRGGRGGNRQQGGGAGGNRQATSGANNRQGGGRPRSNNMNNQQGNYGQQNQVNRQRPQQGNQQPNRQQQWAQNNQNRQRNNNNNNNNGNQGGGGGQKQRGNRRTYGRDGVWNSTPLTQEQMNAFKSNGSDWLDMQAGSRQNASGGLGSIGGGLKVSGPTWTFPTAPVVETSA